MLPGIMGIAGISGVVFTVEYLGVSTIEDTSITTFTFSSESLGVADSTREIYVLISHSSNGTVRTVNSSTIGGVAGTTVTQDGYGDGSGQSLGTAIIRANVPTGTTGDIVINFSGFCSSCAIGVVRVLSKTTNVDQASNAGTDALTPATNSANVNTTLGGAVLACWACSDVPYDVTWTNCTEKYDGSTASATSSRTIQYSGAVSSGVAAATPLTVSASQTSGGLAGVSISVASIA